MTAIDERQGLQQLAEEKGWQRIDRDRIDVYARGTTRVRVIWRGDSAISGASLYHDDVMTTYTRQLTDVTGWLQR
jgi:hypothetical protein